MASKDMFFNKFNGINNLISKKVIANNEFVDVLNFDITGNKQTGLLLKTRDKWLKIKDLTDGHSLYANKKLLLFIDDNDLYMCDKNYNFEIIDSGYRGLRTSYTEINNSIIISNNKFIKRYSKGKIYNLVPEIFDNNKLSISNELNGTLNTGNYLIACTYIHEDGIESSTNNPLLINVDKNSKIIISNFPGILDVKVNKIRVYISRENSTSLHLYGEYPIDIEEVTIYNVINVGQILDKINLIPLQPGHLIESWNGVLLTAKDNFVHISKVFTYFYDNYLEYDENITLLSSVQDGFFVSDEDNIYFTNNITNPGKLQLEDGAILYSGSKNKRTGDIYFFNKHGQFKGSDGGKIQSISKDFKPDLELIKGASMFLDRNGEDRIISSFQSSGAKSGLILKDWVKIEKV